MAGKRVSDSDLPKTQRALLDDVRAKHGELVAGFNKVLKDLKLEARIHGFQLMDADGPRGDDVDYCCMSCAEPDGPYVYCCDFENCATCCN